MPHIHEPPRSRALLQRDYEVLAQFRYLLRQFTGFSEAAARKAGLTAQQQQALLAIRGFPGRRRVAIGELAERLNTRHHSVVGLIDRLAQRTLIRRHRDRSDGRRVLLEVTAEGMQLLARLTHAHREELRRLAPLLERLLQSLSDKPRSNDRPGAGRGRKAPM